jgi:hypothetical protein
MVAAGPNNGTATVQVFTSIPSTNESCRSLACKRGLVCTLWFCSNIPWWRLGRWCCTLRHASSCWRPWQWSLQCSRMPRRSGSDNTSSCLWGPRAKGLPGSWLKPRLLERRSQEGLAAWTASMRTCVLSAASTMMLCLGNHLCLTVSHLSVSVRKRLVVQLARGGASARLPDSECACAGSIAACVTQLAALCPSLGLIIGIGALPAECGARRAGCTAFRGARRRTTQEQPSTATAARPFDALWEGTAPTPHLVHAAQAAAALRDAA